MSTDPTTPTTESAGTQAVVEAEAVVLSEAARPKLARKARTAVNALLGELSKSIAQRALEPLLTDEVIDQLQAVAEEEAARQLAAELAGTEEPPVLKFPTLKHFVDGYVCQLYRRNISHRNQKLAWCPKWWIHGEAFNRLDALWSAFEHLRKGGTTEMSVFFLQHLDPHMAVLLDPHGPFEFCSVADGHSDKLRPLSSPAAPESAFVNYEEVGPAAGVYETTASGIWVPSDTGIPAPEVEPELDIDLDFPF